ncbi:unnamed protein product [Amoebophrya sp. A25]|nr:unnamed protein product [Amoebophrya sp. A25]|eukprot:GSA25T00020122001.1
MGAKGSKEAEGKGKSGSTSSTPITTTVQEQRQQLSRPEEANLPVAPAAGTEQKSPTPSPAIKTGKTPQPEGEAKQVPAVAPDTVQSVTPSSSDASADSYNMAESMSVGKCVDLLLFNPEEIRVLGESLSIIAGNADNDAEYPLEEDLAELAKEKLAAMITPEMRVLNCSSTMVNLVRQFIDRSTRAVVNKGEILPTVRNVLVKQVTELLALPPAKVVEPLPAKVAKDYWVWSTLGSKMAIPPPYNDFPAFPLLQERLGMLLAIDGADKMRYPALAKRIASDVHVLLNLGSYLEYEESLPCEKQRLNASGADARSLRGQMARRVLSNVLPERTVLQLIPGPFDSIDSIVLNAEKTVEGFAAQPLIVPVFKEPKKKGSDAGGKKGKADAPKKADAPAAAPAKATAKKQVPPPPKKEAAASEPVAKKAKTDSVCSNGGCPGGAPAEGKVRNDELGTAIYYMYMCGVGQQAGSGSGASTSQVTSSGAGANMESMVIEGKFDTVWSGRGVPQGHTEYSFRTTSLSGECTKEVVEKATFGRVWGSGTALPQGHTEYSFFFGTSSSSTSPAPIKAQPAAAAAKPEAAKAPQQPAAQKKAAAPAAESKKPAAAAAPATASGDEVLDALKKLDIRVAKIIEVERIPDSPKLYKLQVDMGNAEVKQICSGIVAFYPDPETLNGRKVIAYYNIKPAKLAGQASEGMILAGAVDNKGPNEKCEILDLEGQGPDVEVGTKITIKDVPGCGDLAVGTETVSLKNISKQWGKAQPAFQVNDRKAYVNIGGKACPWVVKTTSGSEVPVVVASLTNSAIC